MSVELCGIDASEVKQGEGPAQALSNEAKDKRTLAYCCCR
jgi:endonuclease YncB( thermonuclease family)